MFPLLKLVEDLWFLLSRDKEQTDSRVLVKVADVTVKISVGVEAREAQRCPRLSPFQGGLTTTVMDLCDGVKREG